MCSGYINECDGVPVQVNVCLVKEKLCFEVDTFHTSLVLAKYTEDRLIHCYNLSLAQSIICVLCPYHKFHALVFAAAVYR